MKTKDLCDLIIKNMRAENEEIITTWFDFSEARKNGIISEDIKKETVLRALNYGVKHGYFSKEWRGIGMTPWSGSAKRQRNFILLNKETPR